MPGYLEDWYYYGRLDPGCSCLITSAMPSLLLSATETTTAYDITAVSTSSLFEYDGSSMGIGWREGREGGNGIR